MRPSQPGFFSSLAMAASIVALLAASAAAQPIINEIRIDNIGTDTDEYFELRGTPGFSLDGLTYIVVGDSGSIATCGVIEEAISLNGFSIQADGLFAAADAGAGPTLSGYDAFISSINFENSDNVTHMLVSGFTGAVNQDLDTNDDGVFDVTPWTAILDCVGLTEGTIPNCQDPDGPGPLTADELLYCATIVGPDGNFVPGHVYRCRDTQVWQVGQFNPLGATDTPGAPNFSCLAPSPDFIDEVREPCAPAVGVPATATAVVLYATGGNLHYRVNGGSETVTAMTATISGDTARLSGVLPAQITNGNKVEYYVRAYNANQDTTRGFNQGYFAGTMNIGDVRVNDANGSNVYRFYGVRLRGTATVAYGVFGTTDTDYYFQDATGGINVFKFGAHQVRPALWDDIIVEGILDQFNGKLEITDGGPCDSLMVTIVGEGFPLSPKLVNTCNLDEDDEGLLVRMQRVRIETTDTQFPVGNSNYNVTNCSEAIRTMRIDGDTNIPGNPMTSKFVNLVGIGGQFDFSSPFDWFYQIQPRSLSDITFLDPLGVEGPPEGALAWLSPNVPNPFARTTRIHYRIPAGEGSGGATPVRLTVLDVQGRVVATLVDQAQSPGDHAVTLDARTLGSVGTGILFYRLEVGGEVLSRRMVFLK